MGGGEGSISALVWILVKETSRALETQNPAEPGQMARAGTNHNAPKHYAGSPQTSSHQSIPEVCLGKSETVSFGDDGSGRPFLSFIPQDARFCSLQRTLSYSEGAKEKGHPRRSRGQPKPGPLDLSLCPQPGGVQCTACVCVLAAHSCPGRGWSILPENAQDKNCYAPAPEQLHRKLGSLAVN